MSVISQARDHLRSHFGFIEFREGQQAVIEAIAAGRDCVVVMPTGGGKSLCYQLPAVMQDGVTLVVSPLIALMKDQVDSLAKRGIPATFVNSSLSYSDVLARLSGIRNGAYKIVYIAPERFRNDAFGAALAGVKVNLFAVDEAHCVSHWGHDFRPDYLNLASAATSVGRPPIVALTATATQYVRQDIALQLRLNDPQVFVAGFDRPNLRLEVVHIGGDKEKLVVLREIVSRSIGSGIIYAATRKAVETISAKLKMAGLSVDPYHAGMTERERTAAQDRFVTGKSRAIIATNAFGMGIDKSDIRFVAHYHLPSSIEAYYQEIGRAGRDGGPADCFLLFNYADTRTHRFFIDGAHPSPDLITSVYRAIRRLMADADDAEITVRAIQSEVGSKNEMSIQSALAVLEQAGHIDRGRESEAVVFASLTAPLDTVLSATSPSSAEGLLIRNLIYTCGVSDRQAIELDIDSIARDIGFSPAQVRGALNGLQSRALISHKNARRGRGVRLLRNGSEPLNIDYRTLSSRAASQHAMLRKMVDYCYSKKCLHGFVLSYFGDGKKIARCTACSVCAPEQTPAWLRVASNAEGKAAGALRLPAKGRSGTQPRSQSSPQSGSAVLPSARKGSESLGSRSGSLRPDESGAGQTDEYTSRQLGVIDHESQDGSPPVAEHAPALRVPRSYREPPDDESGKKPLEPAAISNPGFNEDFDSERDDPSNPSDAAIDGDEAVVVKRILSCVARLNGRFGKGTIASVLRGSQSREVATHNLQRLPAYGLLSDVPAGELTGFIKSLIKAGCITVSNSAYPTLTITDLGREILHGGAVRLETPEAGAAAGDLESI